MNNFKPFAGAALAVSLGASAMSANAAPLDWTLKNVTFGDDGTVSGAFSTNSATGAITTYDMDRRPSPDNLFRLDRPAELRLLL